MFSKSQLQRLFALADLDYEDFTPTMPTVHVESREAWVRTMPENRAADVVTRVEAGTYGGKVAYFQIIGPWDDPVYDAPDSENVGKMGLLIFEVLSTCEVSVRLEIGLSPSST